MLSKDMEVKSQTPVGAISSGGDFGMLPEPMFDRDMVEKGRKQ